jgi:hypothetical protein
LEEGEFRGHRVFGPIACCKSPRATPKGALPCGGEAFCPRSYPRQSFQHQQAPAFNAQHLRITETREAQLRNTVSFAVSRESVLPKQSLMILACFDSDSFLAKYAADRAESGGKRMPSAR